MMPPRGLEEWHVSIESVERQCLRKQYLVTTLSRPNMLAHCPAPVCPRYGKFLR